MLLFRSAKSVTKSVISSSKMIKSINFSSNKMHFFSSQKHLARDLHSKQMLQHFESLLNQNTQQSLTEAAKYFAQLQLKVQHSENKIKQYENLMLEIPENVRHLIQKIRMVKQNIKLQDEQFLSIKQRAQKEINDCKNYSISSIGKQILQVADCLTKSKKFQDQNASPENEHIRKAIDQAHKQIEKIFLKYGIQQFDPKDKEYDPNTQSSLSIIPTQQASLKNKVAVTERTGYLIKGRLLRSALVVIYG